MEDGDLLEFFETHELHRAVLGMQVISLKGRQRGKTTKLCIIIRVHRVCYYETGGIMRHCL